MKEAVEILLAKWLSGELTDAEEQQLLQEYDLESLQAILEQQEKYTPIIKSEQAMWEAIQQQRKEQLESATDQSMSTSDNSSRKWIWIVLGIFALALLSFFLFKGSDKTSIETKDKPQQEIQFADGSSAIAGPQSTLSYNAANWAKERKVALDGQAFFDVEKGVPFLVNTAAGFIEVLGTQFDVWNIDPNYMRVSCAEGMVRVTDNAGNAQILTPAQEVYIIEGQISTVVPLKDNENDWRQNFRNYQTTPVKILFEDLERFYDFNFNAEKSIKNDVFSGILPTNDLSKCIRFIETSLSYDAKQQEKNISFKKVQ